jgi:hypothetical protein
MSEALFDEGVSLDPISILNLYNSNILCDIETDTFKPKGTRYNAYLAKDCILATFTMRVLVDDGTVEPVKYIVENADLMETMTNLVGRMSEGH